MGVAGAVGSVLEPGLTPTAVVIKPRRTRRMTNVRTHDTPPGSSARLYGVREPRERGGIALPIYIIKKYLKTPEPTTAQVGHFADCRYSTDAGATWVEPRQNANGPADNLFGEAAYHNSMSNQMRFPAPHWGEFGAVIGSAHCIGVQ